MYPDIPFLNEAKATASGRIRLLLQLLRPNDVSVLPHFIFHITFFRTSASPSLLSCLCTRDSSVEKKKKKK